MKNILKHFEVLARYIVKDPDIDKINEKTKYIPQPMIRGLEVISFCVTMISLIALGGFLGTVIPIFFVSVLMAIMGLWLVTFQIYLFMELKIRHLEIKRHVVNAQQDIAEKEISKKYREERLALQRKLREEDPDGYDEEEPEKE